MSSDVCRAAAAIRRRLFWIPLLFLSLLSSCRIGGLDPCLPPKAPSEEGRGAMLVQSGYWLYRLGGWDDSVLSSPAVSKALVGEEGQAEGWQESASLPAGLRHGAAFSAGNFVYVLGGSDDNGPVDTVYYTAVHADGSLGFGADDHWEANIRPLPEGRSSAAWVVYDGWIFLIGGMTALGTTSAGETDSIIRARIYQDGQVGQWYTSAETLPEALWGASAAEMGGRLYVAGGANSQGAGTPGVMAGMVSFALGAYGALSDRRIEADLPIALQKPILLADRDDLILAGGFSGESWSSKVYRCHDGVWTDTGHESMAEGPFFGQTGGSLLYQRSLGTDATGIGRLDGLDLAPEAPTLLPGSGMVPGGSPVLVGKVPGSTIRYRTDGMAPSAGDPSWQGTLETPFRITSTGLPSMELSLAAFGSDGSVSPFTRREYRLRQGSLFIVTEGTIPLHDAGYSSLDGYVMQVAGADGTAAPLRFFLGAGDYYIRISDIDDLKGRSFGLSLLKE